MRQVCRYGDRGISSGPQRAVLAPGMGRGVVVEGSPLWFEGGHIYISHERDFRVTALVGPVGRVGGERVGRFVAELPKMCRWHLFRGALYCMRRQQLQSCDIATRIPLFLFQSSEWSNRRYRRAYNGADPGFGHSLLDLCLGMPAM